MRSDRSVVREGNRTVLTLNPDRLEGLRAAADSNQIMLAMMYATDVIEELSARVEELEKAASTVAEPAVKKTARTAKAESTTEP